LENIYNERFSYIFHLVPFYNGSKSNVIPVYENSHYFQGYIAQGFKNYFNDSFTHYFFIGDDVLLNPIINENNYEKHLKLNSETSFLPGFISFHETNGFWDRSPEAYYYKPKISGIEINNQLPNYETSMQKFNHHNLTIKPLNFDQITKKKEFPKNFKIGRLFAYIKWKINRIKNRNTKYNLAYPLVGSYSDIFVVSSKSIKQFCHYCGIFAVTKLFVEIGLPTALVLSSDEIVTEKDLKLQGRALWVKEDFEILNKYNNQLDKILVDFPKEYLYLHPIKLSKWKINI